MMPSECEVWSSLCEFQRDGQTILSDPDEGGNTPDACKGRDEKTQNLKMCILVTEIVFGTKNL